MDFKKILDDYMKQLDCTAKDLAESSGLSAATISRYRSGNRVPEDGSENFDRLINGIISIAESKGIPDITVQSVSDAFSPYVRNSVDIVHFQKNFHTLLTVVPINISDLAHFLNFDPSYISRIRNGQRQPANPTEFARKISAFVARHCQTEEPKGVEVRMIDISDGRLDEEKLAKICDEKTKVLSISWVQALNGMVTDLQMCSEFCQTHDIVFVVDAIQGLGVLPIDVKKVHIDFLVSGFFKWLLGPDGIAFVYINQEILGNLNNPFIGWAGMKNKFDYTTYKFDLLLEARRYETGNMNFSGIFGARQGVEIILEHQEEIGEKVQNLTQYLRDAVQKLDGAEVLSPAEGEMAGITLIGCRDSKQKYELLQKKGITVNYRNGIRVSLHFYNTTEDIDCFLGTIR